MLQPTPKNIAKVAKQLATNLDPATIDAQRAEIKAAIDAKRTDDAVRLIYGPPEPRDISTAHAMAQAMTGRAIRNVHIRENVGFLRAVAQERLGDARLMLRVKAPYSRALLTNLTVREVWGLGTIGVTHKAVLIYDPAWLAQWTPEQIAGLLMHELMHLMMRHGSRRGSREGGTFNVAGDLAINPAVAGMGLQLPPDGVWPKEKGWPEHETADEYYERLMATPEQPEEQGTKGKSKQKPKEPDEDSDQEQDDDSDEESDEGEDGDEDGEGSEGEDEQDEPDQDGAPDKDKSEDTGDEDEEGGGAGEDPGEEGSEGDDSKDGKGGKGEGQEGSDKGSNSPSNASDEGDGGAGGGPGGGSGEGAASGPSGSPENPISPRNQPGVTRGHCGSCAGNPLDGEEVVDDEKGRTDRDMDRIMAEVAQDVQEHAKSRGNVPGMLKRWAEYSLEPPKIPWQQRLAFAVRRACNYAAGAVTPRWDMPSKRQAAFGYGRGAPILPIYKRPVPQVAIIVDTSGSMSQGDLQACLRESGGVLAAVGAEVQFCACDAQVNSFQKVTDPQKLVELLKGGGGTDFRPPLKAVDEAKPRPEVVVFMTDGMGPAPVTAPRGIEVIWLLVGRSRQKPYAAPDGDGYAYSGASVNYGTFIEVDD